MWATLPRVRQFVETLREVNKTLPVAKRIRLVGGNQGVDWSKVRVGSVFQLRYRGRRPDKDMTGSIPLTAAQQRELERRNSITSDPQRSTRARFQGRDQWFRAHPNRLPPAPELI